MLGPSYLHVFVCASQDNITYPSAHFFLVVLINSSVTQILHIMTIIVSVGLECVNEQRLCARDELWFDVLEFCLRHAFYVLPCVVSEIVYYKLSHLLSANN